MKTYTRMLKNSKGAYVSDEHLIKHDPLGGFPECDNCENGRDIQEDKVAGEILKEDTEESGYWCTCSECGRSKYFGYV